MARKALKDWTQADYNQFSPDEAMQYYNKKLAAGDKANAKYWFDQWQYHYQNKENEETKSDRKKATDPLRNIAYGTAGALTTAGALYGANQIGDAIKTAKTAKDVIDTTNTVNSLSNAGTEGMSLADSGLGSLSYGGEPLFGTGASVGADTATTGATNTATAGTEGLGLGAVTIPLLAASLADMWADKQSKDIQRVNISANPIGTLTQNVETLMPGSDLWSGNELSKEQKLGMTGGVPGLMLTGGLSAAAPFAYDKLFANGGVFGSSKGKDQVARDSIRGYLEEQGIIPDNDVLKFGDNTEFSMYNDGGARLDNFGKDDPRYDNNQRHYYDVDFTNPESEKSIQDIDPLALALLPEDMKMKSDLTGYLVNAVQTGDLANKGTRTQELYNRFGGYDSIKSAIEDRFKTGLITEEQKNSALASVDRVMGYKPSYSFGMGA